LTSCREDDSTERTKRDIDEGFAGIQRMKDDFADIKFTNNDQWIAPRGESWRVGITDFAQDRLGDIVHVELPELDDHHYEADEEIGLIESLSGSIELRAPVAGVVTGVNTELLSNSDLINRSPYDEGWIVEMTIDDESGLEDLMDIDDYEAGLPEDDDEE
jgi:glycine cleavage system H protein